MKTLKITLTLVAIALLTISGVQSDSPQTNEKSDVNQPVKIDLIAHGGKKLKVPSNS